MEKTTLHRKKQFVPNAFKFLIAAGSVAGTLGIWNLLSNRDLQVNAQNLNGNQTLTNINQAPLPTLVPLLQVNVTASGITVSQPVASVPLREVGQASGSSTSLNPSDTQSNPVFLPAPVTTTRSSRP